MNKLNIKTTRALRDILSMILAVIKDKRLENYIDIFVKKSEIYPDQSMIVIRFRKDIE